MSAMDGLLKALGAPSSLATKEEDSKEERPHGSVKEKHKEEEEEEEEGGKEKNKENADEEEEGEEGDEEEEKGGKDTPSLESRRVDMDRVRATGADVDAAKKEEISATSALAECTATTQRCVAAHASAKARLAYTNNILRLAALERRADILRQLESADAAVAVFDPDPATPLTAPSVPLVHPFPVDPSRALSARLPTPPATTTFQAQHGSGSETTSKNFPTISANPPTSPVAPDTNDPVVLATPPAVRPTPPVFSATLPVALVHPMPDVASAFDRGTPAHTPPLMPKPTALLAFEMVDLTFFNATLDQIRQAEGIDRQDSEDMSCAATVLLQFFPDHSDPPTAVTVATTVDRAGKDHSSAYISATNTLLVALRGFHDPNGPGVRHSWGQVPKNSSFATTSPPDHVTVGGITPPSPPEHLDIEEITAHRMARVDGFTTVAYKVHWVGDVSVSWEQELRLQHFRPHITRYWCGTPTKDYKINKMSPQYHQRRIDAAQRESSRSKGELFLAPGFKFTPRFPWLQKFAASDLPKGTSFWYKAHDGLWWLGEIAYRNSLHTSPPDSLYIGGFVDRAGPIKVNLEPDRYISAPTREAKYGAWCLQCPATAGA